MNTQEYRRTVVIPGIDNFLKAYPRFKEFVQGTGGELYAAIMQPAVFIRAEAAAEFGYPSVLAVAEISQNFWRKHNIDPRDSFSKQCVGSAICLLMEVNGYRKSGTKKSVPHPAFTSGEVYLSAQ